MRPIPTPMREKMATDPYYKTCIRARLLKDHVCEADPMTHKLIDWEHVLIYASKQVNEIWAIIPICWLVHRGGKLNKEINLWIALNRATDDELRKYSKAVNYIRERDRLNNIYGNTK